MNISVEVGADNKAVLFVALDRSDKDYFACDAGCLDAPVELGPTKKQFPVKVTAPATAVLYITSDRKHVEELRLSIHVKEVLEGNIVYENFKIHTYEVKLIFMKFDNFIFIFDLFF